jgi:dsRNA-specific ribonuclease
MKRKQNELFRDQFDDRQLFRKLINDSWCAPQSTTAVMDTTVPPSPGSIHHPRNRNLELAHWQRKILPIVKHRLGITPYRSDCLDAFLTMAFIHKSYVPDIIAKKAICEVLGTTSADYERLEHIGDGFLNYTITWYLYNMTGELTPGEMTSRKSFLCSNRAIAFLVHEMGLHRYVIRQKFLPLNMKIIADVFESTIGALVLTIGEENTRSLIIRLFDRLVSYVNIEDIIVLDEDNEHTESLLSHITDTKRGKKRKFSDVNQSQTIQSQLPDHAESQMPEQIQYAELQNPIPIHEPTQGEDYVPDAQAHEHNSEEFPEMTSDQSTMHDVTTDVATDEMFNFKIHTDAIERMFLF